MIITEGFIHQNSRFRPLYTTNYSTGFPPHLPSSTSVVAELFLQGRWKFSSSGETSCNREKTQFFRQSHLLRWEPSVLRQVKRATLDKLVDPFELQGACMHTRCIRCPVHHTWLSPLRSALLHAAGFLGDTLVSFLTLKAFPISPFSVT